MRKAILRFFLSLMEIFFGGDFFGFRQAMAMVGPG
jgi:hypothetical protein